MLSLHSITGVGLLHAIRVAYFERNVKPLRVEDAMRKMEGDDEDKREQLMQAGMPKNFYPEGWLSFLLLSDPAGENCLPSFSTAAAASDQLIRGLGTRAMRRSMDRAASGNSKISMQTVQHIAMESKKRKQETKPEVKETRSMQVQIIRPAPDDSIDAQIESRMAEINLLKANMEFEGGM